MAATATARSSAPAKRRKPPARKPATRRPPATRRRQQTPIVGFVPVAAVRTVGGIADSGLVVRLTRGRWWIGLLGALLVGIVALNVFALSFSSSSSTAGRQADELKRQNSALRAQLATTLSNDEIQAAALALGLFTPEPGQVRYLKPDADDAAEAARRLRAGELGAGSATAVAAAPAEVAPVVPAETAPVTDPAAVAPLEAVPETAPAEPAAVDPAAAEPTATPAPDATAPDSGGGLAAP